MIIYPTQERGGAVVDLAYRDADFDDASEEVDLLKPISLSLSSRADDSDQETLAKHIEWSSDILGSS